MNLAVAVVMVVEKARTLSYNIAAQAKAMLEELKSEE